MIKGGNMKKQQCFVAALKRMGAVLFVGLFAMVSCVLANGGDLITVKGTGAPPANMAAGQAKLMCKRAAVADGYRMLAEVIMGVKVDSQTTVKNFVTESDVINTKVQGFIKGATISDEKYLADGTCQVTVTASKNQLMEIFPPAQPIFSPIEDKVEETPVENKENTDFWGTHTKRMEFVPEAGEHNEAGLGYLSKSQYQEALNEFQSAVDIDPNFDIAWGNLGIAYKGLKQYESSEEKYHKAMSIDPEWSDYHVYLANLYRELGRLEDAKAEAMRAVELYEQNEWAQDSLTAVYESLGDFESAVKHAKLAVKYCPKDDPYLPTYYYYLALDLVKIGKKADAKTALQAALKIRPDYWEAKDALANM